MDLGARPLNIAVVGGGIAGLSAAWLLSQRHRVTLFEADQRLGGHADTAEAPGRNGPVPVDTGFIVYNEANYPNFTALLDHLNVASRPADMSLSISLDSGAFEYSSYGARGVFAQTRNLFSARFWGMLRDIARFYRESPKDFAALEGPLTSLDDYLREGGYGEAFRNDHILPQAAAIWSTPLSRVGAFPAASLIRFFQNHGMMQFLGRGRWRTVEGGSRAYVSRLVEEFRGEVRTGAAVAAIHRDADGVTLKRADGQTHGFDEVVIATHADQARMMLARPSADEIRLLETIRYSANTVVLHTDARLMPRRRRAWASWNHIGARNRPDDGCVTYWMNRLQGLEGADKDILVTLNPITRPAPETIIRSRDYHHPMFDAAAIAAQRQLWSLQGRNRTWFCGSYFGHGFHEDGLQSGLGVAEALGGVRRPWTVENESARIHLQPQTQAA
ncbi:NAD(P)/FAD-dependent oxidoreductase [Phenylobacterium immobile]|uniref:NAD(P)/FAD-dependent oxidoreductase n=1 Tax=Phenylobacterium immobile TaxID=21 RepID=UPI000AA3486F|nr:FAD-dependent oxidoreductase [Phenylobacterium immobile]